MSIILSIESQLGEGVLGTVASYAGYGPDWGDKEADIVRAGMHRPGSSARKSLAQGIRHLAGQLPERFKSHWKGEVQHACHAVGCLKSWLQGKKPSPEQISGLHHVGTKALWAAGAAGAVGRTTREFISYFKESPTILAFTVFNILFLAFVLWSTMEERAWREQVVTMMVDQQSASSKMLYSCVPYDHIQDLIKIFRDEDGK